MKSLSRVLASPVLTEKSSALRFAQNEFVFRVLPDANKIEIKKAVEKRFNVIVENVRTLTVQGKFKTTRGVKGQRAAWKKAFVKVRKGDTITEFEGA